MGAGGRGALGWEFGNGWWAAPGFASPPPSLMGQAGAEPSLHQTGTGAPFPHHGLQACCLSPVFLVKPGAPCQEVGWWPWGVKPSGAQSLPCPNPVPAHPRGATTPTCSCGGLNRGARCGGSSALPLPALCGACSSSELASCSCSTTRLQSVFLQAAPKSSGVPHGPARLPQLCHRTCGIYVKW